MRVGQPITAAIPSGDHVSPKVKAAFARCRHAVIRCLITIGITGGVSTTMFAAPVLPPATVASSLAISARFAVHEGYDRLVLASPATAGASWHQDGNELIVDLAGAGNAAVDTIAGRRILSVTSAPGRANLFLAPGGRARVWRMEQLLVIDVLTPQQLPIRPAVPVPVGKAAMATNTGLVTAAKLPAPVGPQRAAVLSQAPVPGYTSKELPAVASVRQIPVNPGAARTSTTPPTPPSPSRKADERPEIAPPVEQAAGNGANAVSLLAADDAMPGPAILFPLGREVGAAAFLRAGEGHVVFDVARPLDLSALKEDSVFGEVTEQLLPDGMHLQMRLRPSLQLRLFKHGDNWAVAVVPEILTEKLPNVAPLAIHPRSGRLIVDAAAPGHVVVLNDEATGGRLFVGTQCAAGQKTANDHRGAEMSILSTWQGMVVAPIADRFMLRATSTGFELSMTGAPDLAMDWSGHAGARRPDGTVMTRVFDFTDQSVDMLHRQLGQALRDAALTPRMARYHPRVNVAQAMLSLGLDAEASAVLQAAKADDPTHGGDPAGAGLGAIAAWLSAQAGGGPSPKLEFDPATLGGSDEAALWQSLLPADPTGIAKRSAAIAAVWPLVLDYPAALRRMTLAPVAALLAAGGQEKALTALLAASPEPALDLIRAAQLQSRGKTNESLAVLDRLASGTDRLVRATAMEQGVETRLAAHRVEPAIAAAMLDRQIYAWRGGVRELRVRERVANLRAQAGAWRNAMSMLRDTDRLFPENHAEIRDAEIKVVADLLHGGHAASLGALDLVALANDAASLLTAADTDVSLAPILADKLLALDLPDRAEPILRHLLDQAKEGSVRAALGVRLAELLADRGDLTDASALLDKTAASGGLDPASVARVALLRARLLVSAGQPSDALAALSGQHTPEAAEASAAIMEGQHNWAGAASRLAESVGSPASAKLSEAAQRAAILHIARDESEAGDTAGLHRLRDAERVRFRSGDGAELFSVLTADPVRTAADLPRSASEASIMGVLPVLHPRTPSGR